MNDGLDATARGIDCRMGGTGQRRQKKNAAAASLARRRWRQTTPEQRTQAARTAVQGRWAKARARREKEGGGSND